MVKQFSYSPKGVCCRNMDVTVDEGKIVDVVFTGGCNGNLKGLRNLIKGMSVEEVISKLKGVECGARGTSCPDQLTKALASYESAN